MIFLNHASIHSSCTDSLLVLLAFSFVGFIHSWIHHMFVKHLLCVSRSQRTNHCYHIACYQVASVLHYLAGGTNICACLWGPGDMRCAGASWRHGIWVVTRNLTSAGRPLFTGRRGWSMRSRSHGQAWGQSTEGLEHQFRNLAFILGSTKSL